MRHGVSRHEDGLGLAVWAPRVERLQLRLGDRLLPLARGAGGWWTAELPQLPSGTPYAVVFPDGRIRPDPAARAQVSDVHGPSALFDPGEFRWTDGGWSGVPLEALVFYEMHVGTFTEEGTLEAAAVRLPELVDLGITCVELMPLQPFPGARNWGYDGVLPHAVHGGYGGPAALQRFVDRAHALGLGVCLDVVYNHLGPEGNYLGEFGPYTTSRHHSPWGDGMNYDGPDSGPVRAYMVQAARSWVEDFHVDALRLDAVHAIIDDGPVHLVQDIVRAVHEASGGRARVIAESDLNDRRVVDPPPAGWGCDAAWADDFHHAVHALLTGERSAFYADFGDPEDLVAALEHGFVYRGQRSGFRKRPHGTPTDGLVRGSSSSASRTTIRSGTGPPASGWRASCPARRSSPWPPCSCSGRDCRCSSWARSRARRGPSSISPATPTRTWRGRSPRVAAGSSSPRRRKSRTLRPSGRSRTRGPRAAATMRFASTTGPCSR